jgi:uncharacterized protein (DUF58 family)
MLPRLAPIVPTTRAVVVLALAAPLAVAVAASAPEAWVIAPVLGIVLLAALLVDALLAGRLRDIAIDVPGDAEVGAEGQIAATLELSGGMCRRADIALAVDPRLAPGGQLHFSLQPDARPGSLLAFGFDADRSIWYGEAAFTPSRRGTGDVPMGWLRWTGPLGLGSRQARIVLDEAVRVRPNLSGLRDKSVQALLRNAQMGLLARRIRGEGTQFEALTEYEPGMDRRRIDWKASARHAHLYAKEYEAERNNQIVFAFDCGQAMCEPIRGMPRLDRAVSAALAAAYVALKGGDRTAMFGFAARPEVSSPFVASSHAFGVLQDAAAALEYRAEEPNFTLALATLSERLQRRSLVVVFSDFTDSTSAELMLESVGRLVSRHVVLFVAMQDDELEGLSTAEPQDLETLSMAVSADQLLRQRDLVIRRLRQIGVDVVEAPYDRIGVRLIDAYLAIKRSGVIG